MKKLSDPDPGFEAFNNFLGALDQCQTFPTEQNLIVVGVWMGFVFRKSLPNVIIILVRIRAMRRLKARKASFRSAQKSKSYEEYIAHSQDHFIRKNMRLKSHQSFPAKVQSGRWSHFLKLTIS